VGHAQAEHLEAARARLQQRKLTSPYMGVSATKKNTVLWLASETQREAAFPRKEEGALRQPMISWSQEEDQQQGIGECHGQRPLLGERP